MVDPQCTQLKSQKRGEHSPHQWMQRMALLWWLSQKLMASKLCCSQSSQEVRKLGIQCLKEKMERGCRGLFPLKKQGLSRGPDRHGGPKGAAGCLKFHGGMVHIQVVKARCKGHITMAGVEAGAVDPVMVVHVVRVAAQAVRCLGQLGPGMAPMLGPT